MQEFCRIASPPGAVGPASEVRDELRVAVRAGDRGRDDTAGSEARVPRGPQHSGHGVGTGGGIRDESAFDRGAADLELGLHQQHKVGVVRSDLARGRQHVRKRDERQVPGDQLRGGGDPARLREAHGRHVTDVESLDRDHAGVGGDGCRQLSVTDIHGDHRVGAALAQNLCESAGRCAHIEGEPPRDRDVERVEPGDQLVRRATDVVIGRGDLDHGIIHNLRRRLHHGTPVHRDESLGDEGRGVGARPCESARGHRRVEPHVHGRPVGRAVMNAPSCLSAPIRGGARGRRAVLRRRRLACRAAAPRSPRAWKADRPAPHPAARSDPCHQDTCGAHDRAGHSRTMERIRIESLGNTESVDRPPRVPDRLGSRAQQVDRIAAFGEDSHIRTLDSHLGVSDGHDAVAHLGERVRLVQLAQIAQDVGRLRAGGRSEDVLGAVDARQHERRGNAGPIGAEDVGVQPIAEEYRMPRAEARDRLVDDRNFGLAGDDGEAADGGVHRRDEGAVARSDASGLRDRPVRVGRDPGDATLLLRESERVRGLGQLRPADLGGESLDDGGGCVLCAAGDDEAGLLEFVHKSLAADDQHGRTGHDALDEEPHGRVRTRDDLARRRLQAELAQVLSNRDIGARGVVGDVAEPTAFATEIEAVDRMRQRTSTGVDDAVQIGEHDVDTVERSRLSAASAEQRHQS
ncbi:hypothetical protein BH09BAC2_BH09BAC2_00050 [soil metagenome]